MTVLHGSLKEEQQTGWRVHSSPTGKQEDENCRDGLVSSGILFVSIFTKLFN